MSDNTRNIFGFAVELEFIHQCAEIRLKDGPVIGHIKDMSEEGKSRYYAESDYYDPAIATYNVDTAIRIILEAYFDDFTDKKEIVRFLNKNIFLGKMSKKLRQRFWKGFKAKELRELYYILEARIDATGK